MKKNLGQQLLEEKPELVGGLLRSVAALALFYAEKIDPRKGRTSGANTKK